MHPRPACAAWTGPRILGDVWARPIAAQVASIRIDAATVARIARAATIPEAKIVDAARTQEFRRRRELANDVAAGRISEGQFLAAMAAAPAPVDEPAQPLVTADEVAAYLRNVKALWVHPATTDADRADMLGAIYERITVAGSEIVSTKLTPDAYAHGLHAAMAERVRVDTVSPDRLGQTVSIWRIPIEGRREFDRATRSA